MPLKALDRARHALLGGGRDASPLEVCQKVRFAAYKRFVAAKMARDLVKIEWNKVNVEYDDARYALEVADRDLERARR